jgi:hypothetical protein
MRPRHTTAMEGGSEENARLQGCRRYDPMDGGGRLRQEQAIESNAGSTTAWMQEVV